MSEDLDDLLRRAMKTLEDQVPPGYFDELPKQTLARLEDSSMHDERNDAGASQSAAEASPTPAAAAPAATSPAPTPATALATGTGAPPPDPGAGTPSEPGAKREEDSGLHDIRNLASSQRMRISSKRSSQNPILPDDELLASTSGSWKAVALPEPAKMISLPELSELPPAREVKEAQVKEARPKRDSKAKVEAAAPPQAAQAASAVEAPIASAREAAAAVEAPVAPIAAAREKAKAKAKPAAAGKGGARKAMFAGLGLAVAAAAGAVFVVSNQRSEDKATGAPAVQAADKDGLALPALRSATPPAAAAPEPMEIAAGSAAAEPTPVPEPAPPPDKGAPPPPPPKPGKSVGKYVPNVVEDPKGPEKPKGDEPKKKPEPGDPDFNKLLQEAGYQEKKDDKPKIDKKSLSGDDIKKGMNGVAGKVTACYAGTEGSAVVKVIVAGTGQIQKVTVSGVFAGTPVGACVEAAVRGAAFPPFDGEQQTINFSYLLSE
jgi:hypothetical protein